MRARCWLPASSAAHRSHWLHYAVTVDDPRTWTRPWTFMIPLTRTDEHIYEYACHEGNMSLAGILAGARVEEQAKH